MAEIRLDDWLYETTSGTVQTGPFAGMKLPREQAWKNGALCPMLLGCHEEELHGAIEKEIARLSRRKNPKIINVGCAEGYYAVGLARRLPFATVWAIDTCDDCLRIAREAAALNRVDLTIGADLDETFAAPDLVVMDCEGAESVYLDHARFPGLLRAHIIVEIHNTLAERNMSDVLWRRWGTNHHIVAYREAGRDPNRFKVLQGLTSFWRWMAVCEGRPCTMFWLVMTPKRRGWLPWRS